MEYTDRIIVEQINKKLIDHGRSLDGRPVLRIVWSSDQYEKKRGEHEEWNASGTLFLRKWFGVKNCKKYGYLPDRWIFERLTFLGDNKIAQWELVDARNGTYEPFHVFQDRNGEYLPVNWRIVEYILSLAMSGPQYTSPKEREDLQRKFEDLEDQDVYGILQAEGRSPLFAFDNSVVLDSTKQFRGE